MVGATDETPKSHLPGRVMAEFRAVAARRQLRFRMPTYRQFAPISQVTPNHQAVPQRELVRKSCSFITFYFYVLSLEYPQALCSSI
jgi:hypothetical protein